ncbi:hypothetical protein [Ruminiclostridium papyrosolvens]|uniref:Uncharacterized protein n=1 Tax=Ruminiclostridium papyrosolvens C7 TaxID=1330534 RepID=U4QXY6_9FIRM|nr:hypothetical protein [Ruminiclostridium papyrosolvens]EPR09417.1 hypothetical protein L323_17725 [Ruminiclostridium papyrosolvens C7]
MQPRRIVFIDKKGSTKHECKLNSLPFKDEIIIEKSIELFNDREPCIIHRSYIMKKLMLEINEYFNEVLPLGKGQIVLEEIPKNIRELLNISNEVVKIQLDL